MIPDLVFYRHFSRRIDLLGSQYHCCIEHRCLQLVLVPGLANLDLCVNVRWDYLGRNSIIELIVINIHYGLIVRIKLQEVVQIVSCYCKRCTFGGSSYVKKAKKDEQDHCNWVVRTHGRLTKFIHTVREVV